MTNEVTYQIDDDTRKRVEDDFKNRMKREGIKWGTKTYRKFQFYYFMGAMQALNAMPPYWSICLSSGREIIDKDK